MASWLLASKPICSVHSGSARPVGLLGPLPWGRDASQAGAGDALSDSVCRSILPWGSWRKVGDLLGAGVHRGESSGGAAGDLLAEQMPFFSKAPAELRRRMKHGLK